MVIKKNKIMKINYYKLIQIIKIKLMKLKKNMKINI